MYRITFQTDAAICGPILASLNKPLMFNSVLDHEVDLVLGSDLEIPWDRKQVRDPLFVLPFDIDFASIDLANDGSRRAVYREHSYVRDHGTTDLFILPRPLESWSSSVPLSEAVIKELINRANPPSTELLEQIKAVIPRDGLFYGDSLDFNIVRTAGKYVMLAAGSINVAQAYGGRPFHLFALLYHEGKSPSLVCDFQASP